jgi:bifunctional DNA-binding transcriptional regulator/antitoxin component of YhaV-PrlF toxin-antitoxin module
VGLLTITARGQVTLKQDLLRHLGVKPGDQIEVSALPGGWIEVRAARPSGSIEGFIALLAGRREKAATLEQSLRDLLTAAAAEQDDRMECLATLRRQTPAEGRRLDVAALIREGREQR